MAGTSLLTLLDDITSLLDKVAVLSKLAAKKTVGVLGDDLALNAEQVAGVATNRELPVVWAVAKGSTINKCILVPAALALSFAAPWAVMPLLMLGGLYLCYEGFEKVAHKMITPPEEDAAEEAALDRVLTDPAADLVAFEKDKIKGAIRTDFVLSAEIIVIALGTVADANWPTRIGVLLTIAVGMTIGVYGLVALIVKLDDMGLFLSRRGGVQAMLGRALVAGAPWLMKGLTVAGTVAMFLVGGGILAHGIPGFEAKVLSVVEGAGAVVATVGPMLANGLVGVLSGGLVVGLVLIAKRVRAAVRPAKV